MPLTTQGDPAAAGIKSGSQINAKSQPRGVGLQALVALECNRDAYCISDMTICDMLLLCLSIEVLACISICLDVMLAVSEA